jgi:hypothetical protein
MMKNHSLNSLLLVLSLAAASACGSNTTTGPVGGGNDMTSSAVDMSSPANCVPETRVCNAVDDNCDGLIDDECSVTDPRSNPPATQLFVNTMGNKPVFTFSPLVFAKKDALIQNGAQLHCRVIIPADANPKTSTFAVAGLPAESGSQTVNVGLTGNVIKCQITGKDSKGQPLWSTIAQY